jgi:hypothetical protein
VLSGRSRYSSSNLRGRVKFAFLKENVNNSQSVVQPTSPAMDMIWLDSRADRIVGMKEGSFIVFSTKTPEVIGVFIF